MSTDTQEHTVETVYGEATIETYDCDSCGNRVAYVNTVPFTIGDTEGRACEHCEAEGPVSFPRRTLRFVAPYHETGGERYSLLAHIVFAVVTIPVDTIYGYTDAGEPFQRGVATAVTQIAFWTLFVGCLVVLLA